MSLQGCERGGKVSIACGWAFARNEEANVQKSLSSIKYSQDTWFGRMLLGLAGCLSYAEGWEGRGLGEEGDERSTGLGGASSHGLSNTVTGNIEFDPAHMVCYAGRAGKARGGCEKAVEGQKFGFVGFKCGDHAFMRRGPWWRDPRNVDGWQMPWLSRP